MMSPHNRINSIEPLINRTAATVLGLAVKVTLVPGQTETRISGDTQLKPAGSGLTVIVTVFDVAGLPVAQVRWKLIEQRSHHR